MSVFAPLLTRTAIRIYLWVLHALLVLLILAALWYVNDRYRLGESLLSPFPTLHAVWLPLLFLLTYLGGWLTWWFLRVVSDGATGRHPDIDDAWRTARTQLEAAGIDLGRVPVFVVLGRPRSGVADFFAATALPFTVRHEAAPVGVYANRDAVYVTVPGASALGWYAERLFAATAPPLPTVSLVLPEPDAPLDLQPSASEQPIAPEAARLLKVPSVSRTDLPADQLADAAERLTHFCQLLAAARRPLTPANGVIWLVPAAGTDTDAVAEATTAACKADLAALEGALQIDCPMALVLADAQEFTGFRELAAGLPVSARTERLFGSSLPLMPNLPATDRYPMVAGALEWATTRLIPSLVYQRFGDAPDPLTAAKLWRISDALYARQSSIVRIVCQGLMARPDRPPMVNGVYLAATGPDAVDRGFAAAVLTELKLTQNLVNWTEAALADEADARRAATVGYGLIAAFAIAIGVFGWWTWYR
jgi:IcmF-related N-terminal domain